MADVDDLLVTFLPRLVNAERALRDGDRFARPAIWSQVAPVTFFGAAVSRSGWDDIAPAFEALAAQFGDCRSFDYEVIAAGASGDLAYLVGYEHTTTGVAGVEPVSYSLRVTTIVRREQGEWKVVHHHGDPEPHSASAREQVVRMQRQLS
jgi:ketosteroid isomerase-like protein